MTACQLCRTFRRPAREPRTADHGRTCRICLDVVRADLVQLGQVARELPALLPPRTTGGVAGHAPAGPRLPVSLDALNLLGPGSRTGHGTGGPLPPGFLLREWATAWAIARGLRVRIGPKEYAATPDGRIYLPVVGAAALAAWLLDRLDHLAHTQSEFTRFAQEVHSSLTGARRVAHDGASARPVGWCSGGTDDGDQCMAPLSASTWVDVIACPACGRRYDRRRGQWADLVQLGQVTDQRRSA